jgi:hypothetical protein
LSTILEKSDKNGPIKKGNYLEKRRKRILEQFVNAFTGTHLFPLQIFARMM